MLLMVDLLRENKNHSHLTLRRIPFEYAERREGEL